MSITKEECEAMPDKEWVEPYDKRKGIYVRGYCRFKRDREGYTDKEHVFLRGDEATTPEESYKSFLEEYNKVVPKPAHVDYAYDEGTFWNAKNDDDLDSGEAYKMARKGKEIRIGNGGSARGKYYYSEGYLKRVGKNRYRTEGNIIADED